LLEVGSFVRVAFATHTEEHVGTSLQLIRVTS